MTTGRTAAAAIIITMGTAAAIPTENKKGKCNKMKQTTRAAALLLSLALLLEACSGQKAPAADAPEKSLYRQGQELAAEIVEIAGTPEYLNFYTGNQEVTEILTQAVEGKDYASPKVVYSIRVPESAMESILGMMDVQELEGLPESLRRRMYTQFFRGLPNQVNAMGGANILAATSICTATRTFVDPAVTENLIYLYTYENGVPIVVTFLPGEGGAVSAAGTFLLHDNFGGYGLEELKGVLERLGATITEVTQ